MARRRPAAASMTATPAERNAAPGVLIELENVELIRSRTAILTRVDVSISAGDVVGVVGPNGAGKTTLLRVMAGLEPPSSGIRHTRAPLIVDYLAHSPAIYPELSLAENLTLVARMAGMDPSAASAALHAVGLSAAADRRADRASLGMLRRVEFARVLMRRPDLLLLDEAHAGLDSGARDLVAHVVDDTAQRGGAAVLVSHEIERLEDLASRWLQIDAGTVTPLAGLDGLG